MNMKKKKSDLIKAVHEIEDVQLLYRIERLIQKNDSKTDKTKKVVNLSNLAKLD